MTPILVEPAGAVVASADPEELTLGGLALHSTPFTVEGFEHKPAKKLLEWVRNADSDGAKLLRLPKHETAEIQFRLRVDRQASMDAALAAVGQIVDRVQEAERLSAGGQDRGMALVWSPAGSTFTGTFYVLAGEVDVPKETSGQDVGYLWRFPVVNVTLTVSPFIYGAEVTTGTTTSSLPLVTMTVADVPGDVSAEARYIVTDAASQSRDYVVVGVENRFYNAGAALLIDSASMVTAGFAGSATTRTGAYSADGVIRATLSTTPVAVCSSGELTHIGTFRNYFRLWPSSTGVSVRLAYRQGRDQWTALPWQTAPFEDAFWEPDLGQTKVRTALLGGQTWQWRIEAKSTTAGDTLDVDYHAMIPCEGLGRGRRTVTFETPITFIAYDTFVQSAGALTGKTAPSGQTWTIVTSSDADDFAVESTGATAQRTATGDAVPRMVTAGTTAYAASGAQVDLKTNVVNKNLQGGVLLRSVDVDDYLMGGVISAPASPTTEVGVVVSVAGNAEVYSTPYTITANGWYTTRLVVYANGTWAFWFHPQNAAASQPLLRGYRSELATSGALDDGKVGLYDLYTSGTATTRNYDNFSAWAATDDAVCFSGQSCEFRSYGDDPILREDSTGTYWGRPPEPRGGRLWLPPAGDEDRTTRVAVLARRNDVQELPSGNIADSTSVAVSYRPRYLVVPRQA